MAEQILKDAVVGYLEVSNRVDALNQQVNLLREEKKEKEKQIIEIVSGHQFSAVDSLQVKGTNTTLKIKRPGTWSEHRPVSLSLLRRSLALHLGENAGSECYNFIINSHQQTLLQDKYALVRVISKDE
jgi:hypothetical protein